MATNITKIRNFTIIAHIDHGKSTLADRFLEICSAVDKRHMTEQFLDSMDLEKEKGITIKARCVRLNFTANNNESYQLNLMDTPGHTDFNCEVKNCIYSCNNSIVVIDATKGIQAQTMANIAMAQKAKHRIIVAINKIDLPAARPEVIKNQIQSVLKIGLEDIWEISAKNGQGVQEILQAIIDQGLPPDGNLNEPLQALLLDSYYDNFLGVVILVVVKNGSLNKGDKVIFGGTKKTYTITDVGIFTPNIKSVGTLSVGEIGFITAGIKNLKETQVGDTIISSQNPDTRLLPSFPPKVPTVFCSIFPSEGTTIIELKKAVAKLQINDASFTIESTYSESLGPGFTLGCCGTLHIEIIAERLRRENNNVNIIITSPNITYLATLKNGKEVEFTSPSDMPDVSKIQTIYEKWVSLSVVTPVEFIGDISTICHDKRGIQKDFIHTQNYIILHYEMPFNEVFQDFHDKLKSSSKGYASFGYEVIGYRPGNIVKLDILLNGNIVDALSVMLHQSKAQKHGQKLCTTLKKSIPRENFKIIIQAATRGKILAREEISAYRKDVTANLYGGDVTRKMKLLKQQSKGKKLRFANSKVKLKQETFLSIIKDNNV